MEQKYTVEYQKLGHDEWLPTEIIGSKDQCRAAVTKLMIAGYYARLTAIKQTTAQAAGAKRP